MHDWKKIKETSLPENEHFYSQDITDADYAPAKWVCKDFEVKKLGEYHAFHVQSNTLLLADIFENFRNMCLKIYELYLAKFSSAFELAWQDVLKNTKVKLELLIDISMLLMIEKGSRGGICHSIHWYAKANNRYMKDYDENKELSYLQYWDLNNLYGWAMLQKEISNFEWVENASFKKDFMKNYNEESDEGYFLEVDVYILKNHINFRMSYPFYFKEWKLKKWKSLQLIYMIKFNKICI